MSKAVDPIPEPEATEPPPSHLSVRSSGGKFFVWDSFRERQRAPLYDTKEAAEAALRFFQSREASR